MYWWEYTLWRISVSYGLMLMEHCKTVVKSKIKSQFFLNYFFRTCYEHFLYLSL
jgi:hypothetical protein